MKKVFFFSLKNCFVASFKYFMLIRDYSSTFIPQRIRALRTHVKMVLPVIEWNINTNASVPTSFTIRDVSLIRGESIILAEVSTLFKIHFPSARFH